MSTAQNQIILICEIVEGNLRRSCLRRNGILLTEEQHLVYSEALVLTFLAWHDLLSQFDGYSTRWIIPWVTFVSQSDLTSIVDALKKADAYLLQSVADASANYDRFKHDLGALCPCSSILLGPMKRTLVEWFLTKEPRYLSATHGCLVFLTRLNLPNLQDLKEKAREDYITGERTIQLSDFTSDEESIISQWFPVRVVGDLYDHWLPKHGPGAVSDLPRGSKRSLASKYKQLGLDSRINYLNKRLGEKSVFPRSPVDFDRCSKVVFVPKSIDKLRTICAEPTTLMWYQQGFLRSLMRMISHHPDLSRRINLKDQELSRQLALKGSLSGYYSTIDLSSASDSVSWPLVRSWTKTSCLRGIFLCTRSLNCVLPGGLVMKTNKFAPMGSALCFPTECIVFSAIVEAAIRESGGHTSCSNYRVYGDDIIVESSYADAVIKRLQRNGFTINMAKSFTAVSTHNFRESCGGEYCDGIDVTPVRISRKFSGFSGLGIFTPSRIIGCIDMCNECYKTLPSVRRRLIAALNTLPQSLRPPFSFEDKCGLISDQPTNFHLGLPVWNSSYQEFYLTHGHSTSRHLGWVPADEDIRLFECLRAYAGVQGDLDEPLCTSIVPPGDEMWSKTRSLLSRIGAIRSAQNGDRGAREI